MANITFVLPDDVKFQKALHSLTKAAGVPMPAFVTASFIPAGATHVPDTDPDATLVVVNGAIDTRTHFAPSSTFTDVDGFDSPDFTHGFLHLSLDPDDLDRALDDGLWDVWLGDAVDTVRVLLQAPATA